MCGKEELNGADSVQGLADAIAIVEATGLSVNGRVGVDPSPLTGEPLWLSSDTLTSQYATLSEATTVHHPSVPVETGVTAGPEAEREAVAIVPRCIACSEPALIGEIYCAGHDRLGTYTDHEWSGGIAANE